MLINDFFREEIERRKTEPGDDLISWLLSQEIDGKPLGMHIVEANVSLMLIAGIDTTWSSIGSALWHLATHPEDTAKLVAKPELLPNAIEEFLRAYSPVTMARIATSEVTIGGCTDPTPVTGCCWRSRTPTATPRCSRTPTRSTSSASTTATSRSGWASTAAPAPAWPAWRCASPSRAWLRHPRFRLADAGARSRGRWSGARPRHPHRLREPEGVMTALHDLSAIELAAAIAHAARPPAVALTPSWNGWTASTARSARWSPATSTPPTPPPTPPTPQVARRGAAPGPLHGVPMTVKDSFSTKGMRTTSRRAGAVRPRAHRGRLAGGGRAAPVRSSGPRPTCRSTPATCEGYNEGLRDHKQPVGP
ncbi:MAG: cytochrome P450 [Acidimicrobiales bacterium]